MKQFVFLVFIFATFSGFAQLPETLRKIEVQGSAEMEVEPDEILFVIGIEEYWEEEFEKRKDEDDYKTKVPLALIEDKLIKDLQKAGIEKENVKVRNVGNYWRQRGKEFLFSKQLEVVVRDFSKINNLIGLLDAKGIRNMNIGELRHSKMEELRNEVKIIALKNAREKAAVLVESLGEELGEVIEISELSDGIIRPYKAPMMMHSAEAGMETVDQIQDIKLEYQIRATFRIK